MLEEKPQISEEVKVIPWWAVLLAAIPLLGFPVLSLTVLFPRAPNPPPFPLQVFLAVLGGGIIATLILLVGYVSRDARRRKMNVALWVLLVIFIPNAIGFILYFLLRQPLMMKCPQCGTPVNLGFNYCPACKYSLRPTCPKCAQVVRPDDVYCPHCACQLKGESAV
jgi:hypothetical protein